MARPVAIHNGHPRLRLPRLAVLRAIRILDAAAPAIRLPDSRVLAGELSLVFLTDAALAGLHDRFLDDPSPTDVITFEGDPAAGTAGEICVSVDTAARVAGLPARGPGPAASHARFAAELTLYLVHGWLHLAGYDDLAPARKRRMRAAERRAMSVLHAAGALPAFALR